MSAPAKPAAQAKKNLSIADKALILNTLDKLGRGEDVKLGDDTIKDQKDIANHFGVNKSTVTKLKIKRDDDKQKLRAEAEKLKLTGNTTRTRLQV